MSKSIISAAIVLLALSIVIVNIYKLSPTERTKETANSSTEESVVVNENINQDGQLSVQEGSPAPDFELTTLDGDTVKLSDYKGKKVILNFWASWCPPCVAEMPHMQQFYEDNKENDIEIVAVNLTSLDKGMSEIKKFVDENNLSFTIPLDKDGTIGIQYETFSIPTSYIIDSNGIIIKKIVGPMNEAMMEDLTKNID
ncbi:peroxiredoxin [Cytobacillus horneckiae]|uniref:TlpA family protein disulfide reductase n=1 Tax=Cytobacillus horneckiae TaxID=549687 RepID=A0A2N0ZKZ6_9BACI|nr:TlpA disulfide reductase family protein [Cytobacillus horneckiae]MBN6885614.1 TlpA family protein disulfide reductase [Cytobacillus horneckiae]MEC1156275.1 TlpA disulfide reductase family protein [Cytobacillus horneckiae]MED2938293.1 TlpA disulfide reductase family protein [Cytobacillus horneckiae]PKG30191.1 TlpA family protein disulfide reductase [Cytobacillus horneckiae]